jgi:hypothetical protein
LGVIDAGARVIGEPGHEGQLVAQHTTAVHTPRLGANSFTNTNGLLTKIES